jgi:hypothetical protein
MRRVLLITCGLMLFGLLSLPANVSAQGRRNNNWGRQCGRFVNCHDARDGRVRRRIEIRNRFYSPFNRHRERRIERRERHSDRRWHRG